MSSAVPAPSVVVVCFTVAAVPPPDVPVSRFSAVPVVAVVTPALNRPTSTLTGTAVLDVPSNSTHHSTMETGSFEPAAISNTDFAVDAESAMASTLNQYSAKVPP